MRALLLLSVLATAASPFLANAQWEIQTQATTADLRGIDNVGGGIAWASGSDGTVLRTEDGGYLWQRCTTPPGAEHLDFRGIQAFDANTAIVMSSGKGDLSRLYKTTDGCQTWKLVFSDPDSEGFFDALQFTFLWSKDPNELPRRPSQGFLIGDPVNGRFQVFVSENGGYSWRKWGRSHNSKAGTCGEHLPSSLHSEGIFAASNGSLILKNWADSFLFVTGGQSGSRILQTDFHDFDGEPCWTTFDAEKLPFGAKSDSSGAFAVAAAGWNSSNFPEHIVIVGGDYQKPNDADYTAFLLTPYTVLHPFAGNYEVTATTTPPHGYRSAVAYDATTKTWITVGPNGTDISTDDGRNWRALHPTPGEQPDADQHWNALSLPFVVGPHGRIGTLNPAALKP